MATLIDKSVNQILMSERSVLDFENKLEDIFDDLNDEIVRIIQEFFNLKATDDKVPLGTLRRYLSDTELLFFKREIEKYEQDEDNDWPAFFSAIKTYLSRKRVQYGEMVLLRVQNAVYGAFLRERQAYTDLATTNVWAAYYLKAYDTAQSHKDGIAFVALTAAAVSQIIKARWQDPKFYGNFFDRNDNRRTQLMRELEITLPQAVAAARSRRDTAAAMTKRVDVAVGREKALIRTEINELVNAADLLLYEALQIDNYKFVAVLDAVTTEICRTLNGKVFPVASAQANVNFPPMHTNCRSSTVPDMEGYEPKIEELLRISRATSLENFILEFAPEEVIDMLLEFFRKYRK